MPMTRTPRSKRSHSVADRTPQPWHPDHGGWLSVRRPAALLSKRDLLATHADWNGPIKWEREHGQVVQHWSACVGSVLQPGLSGTFDDEAQAAVQRLVSDLQPLAMDPWQESFAAWEPPAAGLLKEWLADAGYDAQIDDAGNLRLVVKRRGCDGQIRVERRTGRLRFVLPLGTWTALSPDSLTAMWDLADEANSRTGLARVAWIEETDRCRCEGQVDLTGLPIPEIHAAERVEFWRSMTALAVDALEIVLRRLGLELDVLAEDRQHAMRELMHTARGFRAEPERVRSAPVHGTSH